MRTLYAAYTQDRPNYEECGEVEFIGLFDSEEAAADYIYQLARKEYRNGIRLDYAYTAAYIVPVPYFPSDQEKGA